MTADQDQYALTLKSLSDIIRICHNHPEFYPEVKDELNNILTNSVPKPETTGENRDIRSLRIYNEMKKIVNNKESDLPKIVDLKCFVELQINKNQNYKALKTQFFDNKSIQSLHKEELYNLLELFLNEDDKIMADITAWLLQPRRPKSDNS